MLRAALLLASTSLLAACGPHSAGSGSGTLFVYARLTTDGSTSSTSARIQVREASPNGMVVSDAQVTVAGAKLPKVTIPWVEMNNEYRSDGFGWDESLRVEVKRGSDSAEATVRSPGNTVITAPANDGSVPLASPLTITWRDDNNEKAMTVWVRVEQAQVNTALAEDTGSYTVTADKLVQTDREGVHLERSNEVAMAGGVPGSVMSVSTQHYVRFRVE